MAELALLSDEPATEHLLRRVWPYLRPHRRVVGVALALSFADAATLVAIAPIIGTATDALTRGDRHGLAVAAVALLLVVLGQTWLARSSELRLILAGERIVRELREQVVDGLGRAPLRFLEAHRTGVLLRRATGEVADLAAFVRSSLPDLLTAVITGVFTLVLLLIYSPLLTAALVVLFLPPAVLLMRSFRNAAGPAFGGQAAAEATVAGTFAETLGAGETLRATGGLGRWSRRFDRENAAVVAAARRVVVVESRVAGILIIEGLALAALLALGGWLVAEDRVGVGTVVVFILAGRTLFETFDQASRLVGDAEDARTGLARLLDLLAATGPAAATDPAPIELPRRGELRADGLTYHYVAGVEVLHRIEAAFPAGDRAGLVGATGSGKTTLVKLLTGLYTPDGGTVRYAGVDLRTLAPATLRRHIVLVPQEVHVVAGTLADNLALVPGGAPRAEIERAVTALGLTDWVDEQPGGLDTDLGARGERLSAGERQLIGLVRAALVDPAVLVLDEATAHLDEATAARLETALAELRADRTLIVVAHRPSTVARLPRLVRLHAGAIQNEGTEVRTDVQRAPATS
ncbi:ABC transporter ATP-binding protein/permease [Frankia sp. AgPm24]|uniref:ABC transporter ATP-binding protein n=1 Tax=Frankia sp. AgPm24 TaxID=631128 RepID=UPI00200F680A|nr:ABC transporter ATP-binding protein [Frankia sp. AgPm24]MCK9920718.1 ABC transporter ATP-binding protein/permease [Frankia sp. AgPm24]